MIKSEGQHDGVYNTLTFGHFGCWIGTTVFQLYLVDATGASCGGLR